MKLASLKHGRDGRLVVVSRDLTRCADASTAAATMQDGLDTLQTNYVDCWSGLTKNFNATKREP